MTAFFKGKAISQVDEILLEGKRYKREDFMKLVKEKSENKDRFSPAKVRS